MTLYVYKLSVVLPIRCGGEPVHHGDGDGPDAQDADDDHVDQLGEELAVEAVVDPGDEAAYRQQTDADIVQLVKQLGDCLAVTTDRVEEGGHAQTEDGAHEEEQEDELLPELDVIVTLVTQRLHVENNRHHDESDEA